MRKDDVLVLVVMVTSVALWFTGGYLVGQRQARPVLKCDDVIRYDDNSLMCITRIQAEDDTQ